MLWSCILGITEQIIVFVRSVRLEVEAQNINSLSISESICLLSQIENQLSDIFSKTHKLHEFGRISDAKGCVALAGILHEWTNLRQMVTLYDFVFRPLILEKSLYKQT